MKQQSTWQKIIDKIQEQMGVKSVEDWKRDEFALVKSFGNKLTEKLTTLITQNPELAKCLQDETNTKKEPRDWRNYKIDDRTLIGYLTEGKTTTHKDKRNALSLFAFEKPFDEVLNETDLETPLHNTHLKIKQFYHTNWWLYFYDYDDHKRIGRLGRAVLNIYDKHHAEILNIETETATHYRGRVEVDNTNQHLFFDFTSMEANEKHLRISVFVGNGRRYPLAIGVYMNIDRYNSMPSGTIVMEQVTDLTIDNMQPSIIEFDKAEEMGVDISIIEFLREREKNFIKAPNSILTIKDLKKWQVNRKHINTPTKD
jgi:hypothetical protein